MLSEFDRKLYEEDPYNLLLSVFGSEYEKEDEEWEANSNNIYHFDTECVEDNGAYITVLNNLKRISNGSFDIETVNDSVDIEARKANVSFFYRGKEHKWNLKVDDDWFDVNLIEKINKLMKINGESKQFYRYSPDQTIILICVDLETKEKIEQLTGEKYV